MNKRRDRLMQELIQRYKFIRAVHTCIYTRLDVDIQDAATEFFYIVNDILEGKVIDESCLRFVDMVRVHDFLKEDK